MHGGREYMGNVYLPFNFALTLKLLKKPPKKKKKNLPLNIVITTLFIIALN